MEAAATDRAWLGVQEWLKFVPMDFKKRDDWWDELAASRSDAGGPAVAASLGVSMYLTKEAIDATLRHAAALAHGSTFAMTFIFPIELADPEARPGLQMAEKGPRASGTPFVSFVTPDGLLALARAAGVQGSRPSVGGRPCAALLLRKVGRSTSAE